MQAHFLILAGLAGLALGGAVTSSLAPFPNAAPGEHQERLDSRIFLSPDQSTEASSAGLLPSGTKSILVIRTKLKHGDFRWNEEGVPPGKLRARVDLKSQMISVFKGGHEIGAAVVLFGAEGKDTPLGTFAILSKIEDHHSSTYDAPMPFTLRLTDDGVAVHGSEVRPGAGTHGCIGVPIEFARLMFEQVEIADEVEIVA
jgi:hypothetical protein